MIEIFSMILDFQRYQILLADYLSVISIISTITLWSTRDQEAPDPLEITPLIWPPPYYPEWPNTIEYCVPHPDNTKFRNNRTSRLLRKFPFLVEIIYCNIVLWLYQGFLVLTVAYINANAIRKVKLGSLAMTNALNVLDFEQKIPLAYELVVQQFLTTQCMPWVMIILCDIYLAQAVVVFSFLAYGFMFVSNFRP